MADPSSYPRPDGWRGSGRGGPSRRVPLSPTLRGYPRSWLGRPGGGAAAVAFSKSFLHAPATGAFYFGSGRRPSLDTVGARCLAARGGAGRGRRRGGERSCALSFLLRRPAQPSSRRGYHQSGSQPKINPFPGAELHRQPRAGESGVLKLGGAGAAPGTEGTW